MDDQSYNIRVPKKWVNVGMIVTVTALIVAPLTAIAAHSFTDVPDSNTFHTDIAWLADAGVTKGCNPPANTEFCPDDAVTRGQMSAFMHRFAQYIGAEDGTPALADSADDAAALEGKAGASYTNPVVSVQTDDTSLPNATVVELAELTINTPDDGGLIISGMLRPNATATGQATFWLQLDSGTCSFTTGEFYSITPSRIGQEGTVDTSAPILGVVETSSGDHTVTLCARTFTGGPLTVETTLVAEYATSVSKSGSISGAGELPADGVPTS